MANIITFLKKLKHETVTVECKDKVTYKGIVTDVDHLMNLHLKKATISTETETASEINKIVIKGSSIRNIILPDTMNLDYHLVEKTKTPLVPPGKIRRL